MAWTIPDKGTGDNDLQSVVFATDLDILQAGLSGTDCVLNGCAITGGADMTPAVAKGSVLSNGVMFPIVGADVTITTADATNPRLDLIVVTSGGALAVRAGTAAAAPKPPARTTNDVVLGMVYVPAADTTIATTQVIDKRVFWTQGPLLIDKTSTAVTVNTSSAVTTYYSKDIPNGLLTTGKLVRCQCRGTMLQNTGSTQAWTLTITYGGTTVYSDAGSAFGSSASRLGWFLDLTITAVSTSSQKMNGIVVIGDPVASTGTGELGGGSIGVIAGTAAVDGDAADRLLRVRWEMSASSASMETTLDLATLELL